MSSIWIMSLEYATIAEQLFASLDMQKTGKADKALCDAVMDQLKAALGSSRNDVKRWVPGLVVKVLQVIEQLEWDFFSVVGSDIFVCFH